MQISTVNRPSISLKGPVKVPQKEQCGPTPHTPMLEHVFANDSRCRVPMRRAASDAAVALPTKASSTQATGQAKVTRGEASVQYEAGDDAGGSACRSAAPRPATGHPARYWQGPEVDTPMAATKRERPMEATPGPGP
jgi:hypothetical protein